MIRNPFSDKIVRHPRMLKGETASGAELFMGRRFADIHDTPVRKGYFKINPKKLGWKTDLKEWTNVKRWGKYRGKEYNDLNFVSKRFYNIKSSIRQTIFDRRASPVTSVLKGAAARKISRIIPTAIRKSGLFRAAGLGGLAVGAVAMLGVSILKGATNQARDIVYDRYMQDQYQSQGLLNSTRLGLAAGTSRMQNYGSTTGLSNALSRTRHGRY